MIETARSYRGMVTAPHHLASEAGLRVLREGGNAIEAMVAAAAAIAAVYPFMNGLGGDCFWLVSEPDGEPLGIDACGAAAGLADLDHYGGEGGAIPTRGPGAALTVAGAVSGWQAALEVSRERWGGRLPLSRLLEDAIAFARDGVAVSQGQASVTTEKLGELRDVPGFAETYLVEGAVPEPGTRLRQPRLAATLERLAAAGADDFYRGDLARSLAADLEQAGSPLRLEDFERHHALTLPPLSLEVAGHRVFNMPPPTQGLASLLLLGVYERLGVAVPEGFDFVHGLVEATKQAFRVRDREIGDPLGMTAKPDDLLRPEALDAMAAAVDREEAAPWPAPAANGDTVWLGAIDGEGRAVSFIQSLYWEYGSGFVLPESGLVWQNRGVAFRMEAGHPNSLRPHRRPFHTIQPAMAQLSDGRLMVYGTMGGEGQPQTQAMIFARHVLYGGDLQAAVSAPRWLLGRTWGSETTNLRVENRLDPDVVEALRAAGHDVELVGPYDAVTGHAGAIVRHPDGLLEGATDPRSDGGVAAY